LSEEQLAESRKMMPTAENSVQRFILASLDFAFHTTGFAVGKPFLCGLCAESWLAGLGAPAAMSFLAGRCTPRNARRAGLRLALAPSPHDPRLPDGVQFGLSQW
jgi:hypothetical protein